mgnify:CR=1 FL=1
MNNNIGLLVGFGLLATLYFVSGDTVSKNKKAKNSKPTKPKNQPKKIIL